MGSFLFKKGIVDKHIFSKWNFIEIKNEIQGRKFLNDKNLVYLMKRVIYGI